jgi:ATP-dependent DNA ligase
MDFQPTLAYHFAHLPNSRRKATFSSKLQAGHIIHPNPNVTFQSMDGKEGEYHTDPHGWYMSLKLNGIRGIWSCDKSTMKSRTISEIQNNRSIALPSWISQILPTAEDSVEFEHVWLDGELYLGRNRFYEMLPILNHLKAKSKMWSEITYVVFDCYDAKHPDMPFSERVTKLKSIHNFILSQWKEYGKLNHEWADKPCPIIYHEQTVIKSWTTAHETFQKWVKAGEEGAILKKSDEPYHQKRSWTMLKWKPLHYRNAKIISHLLHEDKLKSLQCCWEDDTKTKFSVSGGLNNKNRQRYKEEFPLHSIIPITFYEITENNKPVSAVINKIYFQK